MKLYLVLSIFLFLMPLGYSFEQIAYDEGICSYSFEKPNTTTNIYGDKLYGYNLIEGTKGIYSYEVSVLGHKLQYNTSIQTHSEIICGDTTIQINGFFKSYLDLSHKQNRTKFILNGTFLVPKDATSCIARAQIYGFKDNRNTKCSGNCACKISGLSAEWVSEEKEIWTRDEYFMSKWADELKTSNEDQRTQNRDSIILTIIAVIIGGIVTAIATYYAQNKIHEKKLRREDREKLYIPFQKIILFSITKIHNFLSIKNKDDAEFNQWINIRDSSHSVTATTECAEVYQKIYDFFEKSIFEYEQTIKTAIKDAEPILIKQIKKIKKIDVQFSNIELEKEKLLGSLLLKKIPHKINIRLLIDDGNSHMFKQLVFEKKELKKTKPEIEKLESVKKLKQEQKKILKEANEIKAELEKKLGIKKTSRFQTLKQNITLKMHNFLNFTNQ